MYFSLATNDFSQCNQDQRFKKIIQGYSTIQLGYDRGFNSVHCTVPGNTYSDPSPRPPSHDLWGGCGYFLEHNILAGFDNFTLILYQRVGKINQITHCDWLPEQARWSYLARSGLPLVSLKKNFPKSYKIKSFDQVCSVKMARYWQSYFRRVYSYIFLQVHKNAKKIITRPISSHLDLTLGQ